MADRIFGLDEHLEYWRDDVFCRCVHFDDLNLLLTSTFLSHIFFITFHPERLILDAVMKSTPATPATPANISVYTYLP